MSDYKYYSRNKDGDSYLYRVHKNSGRIEAQDRIGEWFDSAYNKATFAMAVKLEWITPVEEMNL